MDTGALFLVVGLSLILQITAAAAALNLIRLTGRYRAWLLVAAALSFMAVRRVLVMQLLLTRPELAHQVSLAEELVALAASVLMAVGILFIRPVFLDLRRSQEELRDSQERYRSIFFGSRDGILVTNRAGQILAMNPAAAEALQYRPEETLGLHIRELLPDPEARLRFQEAVEASGSLRAYEMTMRGQRGREVRMEVSASVNHAPDGSVLGYQGILRDVTSRRQMEEALRLSEEKFAKSFNSSPAWIMLSTLDGGLLVEVNEAFLQATGYARHEVLGRTSLELGMWVDPAERERGVREIQQRGFLRNLEVRRRAKHGGTLVMLWSAEVMDLGGEKVLLSVYLDITERQRAEAALRQSEERNRLLLEVSPDPIIVHDLAGRVSYLNSAFHETFGWSSAELLGRKVPYVPPGGQAQVDQAVRDLARGGKALSFDTQRLTKDGRLLDIQLSVSRFNDGGGRPAGYIVTLCDVTRHRQAQKALRESEEKYRLVVENACEAIFIAQDGVVKFPNPQAVALAGFSRADPVACHFLDIVHEQDRGFVWRMYEQVLAGRAVVENRACRIITKDGRVRWVIASGVPIAWEGRPAALSFVRDVTDFKRMQQQLLQAQEMEVIGRLASGVAHDFNNILLIIKGYSDLAIAHADLDHGQRARIEKIRESVERGARLVRQLLSLSHRRAGERELINLNDTVRGLDNLLRPLITDKVRLSTALAADLTPVMGDAAQLEQIVMNLVVNALDAMPGGGRLTVETYNKRLGDDQLSNLMEMGPGFYAVIAVSDTGCGMDQDTLGHIFEPFFTTKGPDKGTGLGLSVVYGIVKKLGGGLSVYSEPGLGSTFKVYLPQAKPAEQPPAQESRPPAGAVRAWTILLVEDNDDVRALMAEALRLNGYHVLEAGDGERALALVAQHPGPLDLIISDIVLPGLGGPQVVERLLASRAEARVLFISGYSQGAMPIHDLGPAEASFLHKPFSIDELEGKIREMLG